MSMVGLSPGTGGNPSSGKTVQFLSKNVSSPVVVRAKAELWDDAVRHQDRDEKRGYEVGANQHAILGNLHKRCPSYRRELRRRTRCHTDNTPDVTSTQNRTKTTPTPRI